MNKSTHIHWDNYESWMLLYVDNELTATQKEAVIQFVQHHPDVQNEWNALLQTRNQADTRITFPKKEKLLSPAAAFSDETLLCYIDNELPDCDAQKIAACTDAPMLKKLQLLRQTYNVANPAITYAHKEKLYRRTPLVRMKTAALTTAAAALVIAIGVGIIFTHHKKTATLYTILDKNTGVTQPHDSAATITPIPTTLLPKEVDSNIAGAAAPKKNKTSLVPVTQPQHGGSATAFIPADKNKPVEKLLTEPSSYTPPQVAIFIQPKAITAAFKSIQALPPPTLATTITEEHKRKNTFKTLSEKIKEKAIDILSDDNENINIAGFAINISK